MYNCAIAQNCTLCSLCPAPLQNQIAQLRKLVARVCRSLVHAHWTICLRNCATLTKPKQRPLALTASLSRHNTAQQLRICNNCAFAQFSTTRTQTVLCTSLICLSSICQSLLFCWPIAQLRNWPKQLERQGPTRACGGPSILARKVVLRFGAPDEVLQMSDRALRTPSPT